MDKIEYDFLSWTSFPSSLKMIYDGARGFWWFIPGSERPVKPGAVRISVKVKKENVGLTPGIDPEFRDSRVIIWGFNGAEWKWLGKMTVGYGTENWREYTGEVEIPAGIDLLKVQLRCGAGAKERPAITWFDDLKIYQDDKLIYANDFNNWNPYIGVGVGGVVVAVPTYLYTKNVPVSVGAGVVGSLIGAAIGIAGTSLPQLG